MAPAFSLLYSLALSTTYIPHDEFYTESDVGLLVPPNLPFLTSFLRLSLLPQVLKFIYINHEQFFYISIYHFCGEPWSVST